ncbi:hypothetical protein HA51_04120 [Pantoea rwandensis]|uniref:Cytochrome c domain-containing protein n=2 Tax=Pantoea rwandensis TaxID=1076550 RepID=A0A1X1D337_9GAMM|nr:hypothetical protein HA51_04120 [Pantoea rwandensis]
MAEAVEHSMQYFNDQDLQSVAAYLKSLPPSGKPLAPVFTLDDFARKKGALDYEVNCSACHGVNGEGISGMVPAFAGNDSMLHDPTNMITAMLNGARAPHSAERQTAAGMPSFAWKMDDAQVAGILNYVRSSWGNQASEVKTSDVATQRKQSGAVNKITSSSAQ